MTKLVTIKLYDFPNQLSLTVKQTMANRSLSLKESQRFPSQSFKQHVNLVVLEL